MTTLTEVEGYTDSNYARNRILNNTIIQIFH